MLLEDYISTLSMEEQIAHADIISECRIRDAQITKDCTEAQEHARKLFMIVEEMHHAMMTIYLMTHQCGGKQ